MKFALAATLVTAVSASPITLWQRAPPSLLQQVQCLLAVEVNVVISVLNGGASNAFCSSYIAKTTTSTKTSTVTTVKTVTTVIPLTTVTTTTSTAATPTATTYVYSDCGVVGYDKTLAYFADNTGALGTFEACSAKCNGDANCVSYGFGSGSCLLYTATVANNVNPNPASPYLFYDKACPSSTAPASAAAALPAKRSLDQRAVATPPSLAGIRAAQLSAICSCLIATPSTVTVTVPATTTLSLTNTVTTSSVVTTNVVTSVVTPAPVIVTVTTSVA